MCGGLRLAMEALTSRNRRLYCTLCEPSVDDLTGLGDEVAPGPFMIQDCRGDVT